MWNKMWNEMSTEDVERIVQKKMQEQSNDLKEILQKRMQEQSNGLKQIVLQKMQEQFKALEQIVLQKMQEQFKDLKQIVKVLQKLQEQLNVKKFLQKNGRVIGAVFVGGGTIWLGALLLVVYMIKKKVFASESSYLLPEPWRKIHPTDFPKMEDLYLRKIRDGCREKDTKLNILLLGEVSSGASSFIKSCQTALGRNVTTSQIAYVVKGCADSETEHLTAYDLEVEDGDTPAHLPVRLFDCRGLLDEERGVQTEDIIRICDGHIKIQPGTPINPNDENVRKERGEKNKMHCVVYVLNAQKIQSGYNFVRPTVKEQFEKVKEYLHTSGTLQLVLLTKIDRLGIRHFDRVFYDRRVKECCEMASSFLGVPPDDVLPQANHCDEAYPFEENSLITLHNIWKIMERTIKLV